MLTAVQMKMCTALTISIRYRVDDMMKKTHEIFVLMLYVLIIKFETFNDKEKFETLKSSRNKSDTIVAAKIIVGLLIYLQCNVPVYCIYIPVQYNTVLYNILYSPSLYMEGL